jgi:CBS domain-containing protein
VAILAKEVMTTPVVSVEADTPLKRLAEVLDEYLFSGVPVVDRDNNVIGVVSETDILRYTKQIIGQPLRDPHRFLANNREVLHVNVPHRGMEVVELVASATVETLMTREVFTVGENTSLRRVIELMCERDINRVPVIDEAGKLAGIISRADVIRVLMNRWETFNQD